MHPYDFSSSTFDGVIRRADATATSVEKRARARDSRESKVQSFDARFHTENDNDRTAKDNAFEDTAWKDRNVLPVILLRARNRFSANAFEIVQGERADRKWREEDGEQSTGGSNW